MSNDRIPNNVLTERLANAEARITQLESANRELQSALTVSRTFNKVAVHLVKKLKAEQKPPYQDRAAVPQIPVTDCCKIN